MSRSSGYGVFRQTMALINVGTPMDEVLEAIVETIEAEAPDIACSVYLLEPDGRTLTLMAAPRLPAAYADIYRRVETGPRQGSCGTAAHRNELVIVSDIASDPLWDSYRDPALAAGLASCWSQPIRGPMGEVLGTFALYRRQPVAPGPDDIRFIESAAELAAIAIGRRRDAENLARSEARAARIQTDATRNLTTFFEVSLDMLVIRDKDRRFLKVNQAWETVLGYRKDELEGRPMLDFIHPDDCAASFGQMSRVSEEEDVVGFVNRYRHRDGSYRHLEWRARKVGDLVFGVARDVTQRLVLERQMAEAREAAEAANRAKSEFLANMSHEIRTPLNGVIGVVAALAKTELTAGQRDMVALIEKSGSTLERLVSDVLDFSKIEAGRLELETRVFDLEDELGGLLEVFRMRAQEKGLSFPVEQGPRARGEFIGDGVRIRQVLANLLSNAVKFTSEGEVRVSIDVEDPTLEGSAPSRLLLAVEDTGVGFDAEFARTLFQRFSQADATITRRFGGSGLGLSITRALVELMGGEIAARSEPGKGSRFEVSIPLPRRCALRDYDADEGSAATQAEGPDAAARLAGLKVLLAEDHPINRRVVELILSPFGVELTMVENGAEAVDAFTAGGFEVVLMDMQMPVMDGLAATRAIRALETREASRGRTPVVMLSANAMRQHRLDAAAAGADLHLAKPVTAQGLIGGLLGVLDESPFPLEGGRDGDGGGEMSASAGSGRERASS